jgi:hypothetical protein
MKRNSTNMGNTRLLPAPVSRTEGTEATYSKHVEGLIRAFEIDTKKHFSSIRELIRWFVIQDDKFSASTIGAYRSALIVEAENESSRQNGGEADLAYNIKLFAVGPKPKPKGFEKKTSSKKLKSVPPGVIERLLGHLEFEAKIRPKKKTNYDLSPISFSISGAQYLATYIRFAISFFPRPNELNNAQIVLREAPQTGTLKTFLKFPNSKNSNGRSFGPERFCF